MNLFFSNRRLREQPHPEWQEDAHGFHKHATPGTWKGVFHEHVSFKTQENRNRHVFEPVREAGENLVSEPQGEAQEGGESHPKERAQRLQVRNRPHRLFEVRGRGVSVSGLCFGRERGVTHLRETRLSRSHCWHFYLPCCSYGLQHFTTSGPKTSCMKSEKVLKMLFFTSCLSCF